MFLLAKHIRRLWLRARAGSSGLGCLTGRICRLFTISNIRAATRQGRARTSFDSPNINTKSQDQPKSDRRSEIDHQAIVNQRAIVDQRSMVEPVGIEPTT
jgi:hypothetical protein